jgi:hypothetical protein
VGSTLTCTTTYILEVRFLFLGARDSTPEPFVGDNVGEFEDMYKEDPYDQGKWNSCGNLLSIFLACILYILNVHVLYSHEMVFINDINSTFVKIEYLEKEWSIVWVL